MTFHSTLLEVVKDVPFEIYKVTTHFNPTSTLSQVDLNLETYQDHLERNIVIRAGVLFEMENLEAKPENEEVFRFIKNCKSRPWPPYFSERVSESTAFVEVIKHIFVPFCRSDEVILENNYSQYLLKKGLVAAGLKTGHIGIGSWKTWHGTPDARVRGSVVIGKKVTHQIYEDDEDDEDEDDVEEDDVEEDGDSSGSDRATSTVEGKLKVSRRNLGQVVATCVVSSFTENKLHPEKQPIVPTILIDLNQFRVCLYHCKLDILLMSIPKHLATKKKISRSSMLLLWLTINHRLFLRQLPDTLQRFDSTIKKKLEDDESLIHFNNLDGKNVEWQSERKCKRPPTGRVDLELKVKKKKCQDN